MFRVVRTATLRGLRADAEGARGLRADVEGASAEAERLRERLVQAVDEYAVLAGRHAEDKTELEKLRAALAAAEERAATAATSVSSQYVEGFAARVRAERERDAARAELEGLRADTGQQVEARTNECRLCGAPGGYPYCNADCRAADLADHDCQWPEDCAGCSRD